MCVCVRACFTFLPDLDARFTSLLLFSFLVLYPCRRWPSPHSLPPLLPTGNGLAVFAAPRPDGSLSSSSLASAFTPPLVLKCGGLSARFSTFGLLCCVTVCCGTLPLFLYLVPSVFGDSAVRVCAWVRVHLGCAVPLSVPPHSSPFVHLLCQTVLHACLEYVPPLAVCVCVCVRRFASQKGKAARRRRPCLLACNCSTPPLPPPPPRLSPPLPPPLPIAHTSFATSAMLFSSIASPSLLTRPLTLPCSSCTAPLPLYETGRLSPRCPHARRLPCVRV